MKYPSPQPGDGICPTVSQKHETVAAGYSLWAKKVSEAKDSTDSLHIAGDFFELLQKIPELYAPYSKRFFLHDLFTLRLKYALEWVTTTDSTCERPVRRTYHYLMLGNPRSLECESSDASLAHALGHCRFPRLTAAIQATSPKNHRCRAVSKSSILDPSSSPSHNYTPLRTIDHTQKTSNICRRFH